MSESEANRFLAELEANAELNARLLEQQDDPKKAYQIVADMGYNATPHEIREAILEHVMTRLSPAQLQSLAAGLSRDTRGTISAYGGPDRFGELFGVCGGAAAAV